jgi:MoaA/NifB/PqqE/SkfB family radical SAM enzyme
VKGVKIPYRKYLELHQSAMNDGFCPAWLADAAYRQWEINLAGRLLNGVAIVRERSTFKFGRASYELNLGCNYDCEHCYLGLKRFKGLPWEDRERLLLIMQQVGVLWLQLTGGEPLVDKLFPEVYELAHRLGMMLTVSTNGSRLWKPEILDLLTTRLPYRLVISVYGASAAVYDSLTRRRGSHAKFMKGLVAAHEAGLPMKLNLVVTRHNAHELDAMQALAERLGAAYHVYKNISPTIYGGPDSTCTVARTSWKAYTVHGLQRRDYAFPCGPGWPREHLQDRPRPLHPPDGDGCRGAARAECGRRLALLA